MIGIYKITCTKNNKFYIGSSFDIAARWLSHTGDLDRNKHHNYRLQGDYDEFGLDTFKLEIVQVFEKVSVKDLLLIEEGYIATMKPQYNIRKTTGCDIKKGKKGKRGKNFRGPKRKKKQFASKVFKNLYAR